MLLPSSGIVLVINTFLRWLSLLDLPQPDCEKSELFRPQALLLRQRYQPAVRR